MQIINKKFQNKEIIFDLTKDKVVYLNATKTAKQFGKEVYRWLALKETKEYIQELKLANPIIAQNDNGGLMIVRKGGNDKSVTGTWLHPNISIMSLLKN